MEFLSSTKDIFGNFGERGGRVGVVTSLISQKSSVGFNFTVFAIAV